MKLRVRGLLSFIFTYFLLILNVLKYLLSNTINVVRKILNNQIIKQTTYFTEILLLWVSDYLYCMSLTNKVNSHIIPCVTVILAG